MRFDNRLGGTSSTLANGFLKTRNTPQELILKRSILDSGKLAATTYRENALQRLRAARILDAILWAARSAAARTLADFSEAADHDAAWLGTTRHVLFRDRLDRVFSLGRYSVPQGSDSAAGIDVVLAELTPQDISSMPAIPPGTVTRANMHGSPGWSTGEDRFLLQAFRPGKVDKIQWQLKSETKQEVARQQSPDVIVLFELPAQASHTPATDVATDALVLVLAHSLNPTTGQLELYMGLPSSDRQQNKAWHWRHALHNQPPSGPGVQLPQPQHPASPNGVPDAPVRLRNREPAREEGAA
jgi:hypothetical protein